MVTTRRLSGVKADLSLSQAVNGGNILQPGRVSFLSVSTFTAPPPGAATLVLSSPCQGMFAPAAPEVSGASFYPASGSGNAGVSPSLFVTLCLTLRVAQGRPFGRSTALRVAVREASKSHVL
jgi:hypothetical protein